MIPVLRNYRGINNSLTEVLDLCPSVFVSHHLVTTTVDRVAHIRVNSQCCCRRRAFCTTIPKHQESSKTLSEPIMATKPRRKDVALARPSSRYASLYSPTILFLTEAQRIGKDPIIDLSAQCGSHLSRERGAFTS